MPKETPVVLLSRPAEQSTSFAQRLGEVEIVISPVIRIVERNPELDLDGFDLLIFASQNALLAARRYGLQGRQAFCVGKRTTAMARSLGLDAEMLGQDADALVAAARRRETGRRALFLRGVHSRGQIAHRLRAAGFDVEETILYEQEPLSLNRRARALLCGENPVILPLFSPRSAALMGREAMRLGATAALTLIGMSPAVLHAWQGPEPRIARIAARPDADAMADEVLRQVQMGG